MSVILPGATIGILGGGQLGRMTAMAAEMGSVFIFAATCARVLPRMVLSRPDVRSNDSAPPRRRMLSSISRRSRGLRESVLNR